MCVVCTIQSEPGCGVTYSRVAAATSSYSELQLYYDKTGVSEHCPSRFVLISTNATSIAFIQPGDPSLHPTSSNKLFHQNCALYCLLHAVAKYDSSSCPPCWKHDELLSVWCATSSVFTKAGRRRNYVHWRLHLRACRMRLLLMLVSLLKRH